MISKIHEVIAPGEVYLVSVEDNCLTYISNKCGVATLRETKMEKEI